MSELDSLLERTNFILTKLNEEIEKAKEEHIHFKNETNIKEKIKPLIQEYEDIYYNNKEFVIFFVIDIANSTSIHKEEKYMMTFNELNQTEKLIALNMIEFKIKLNLIENKYNDILDYWYDKLKNLLLEV